MVLIKSPLLFEDISKIVYNADPFYFIIFYLFYFAQVQHQNSMTLFPLTVWSLGWTHISHGIAIAYIQLQTLMNMTTLYI
jgi:hypothetical protein